MKKRGESQRTVPTSAIRESRKKNDKEFVF